MKPALNYSFILLFILPSLKSFAQAEITFESNIFYFDTISYSGNGNCQFVFKNTGNEPLVIEKVGSSGGGFICSSYPKDVIKPGGTGIIKAKYDTQRIGTFHKQLNVYSNASNNSVLIFAKGYVKPIPIPYINISWHNFGIVEAGENLKWEFEIKNNGVAPLVIAKVEPMEFCSPSFSKDTIAPHSCSKIIVCFDTKWKVGEFNKKWNVYTNASDNPFTLSISGIILYSPLIFDSSEVSCDVKKDKKNWKTFVFEFENDSKDTVSIYSITGYESDNIYDGKMFASWNQNPILPNEKRKIIIDYHYLDENVASLRLMVYSKSTEGERYFINMLKCKIK